jgi:hypothetical protein
VRVSERTGSVQEMPHLAALGGHCGHWVGIWWLGDAGERREGQAKMGFREGRRCPAALVHILQGPASITKLSVRIRVNKDIDLHAPCVFEQFCSFQSRCSPHDFGSSGGSGCWVP